jgi:penicillin-binding protein 1A
MTRELKKFGIQNLPDNLSLALGTISLSPLEFSKYFSSFANNGVQVEPNLVNYIEKNANVVYEKTQKSTLITEETQSYIMTTILQDVIRNGTGKQAKVDGIELAGKTGTTNSNVDAWFVGYSPTIQTVIWFGNDDNTPMHSVETGGRIAAPAFSLYYQNILRLYPQVQRKFSVPDGIIEVNIKGKKEYFSNTSKPPRAETENSAEETLLF